MAAASEQGGSAGLTPDDCRLGVTWCICLITAQFTGVTIRDYQNGYFGRCLFFTFNCTSAQTLPLKLLFRLPNNGHSCYLYFTTILFSKKCNIFHVISKKSQAVRVKG